MNMTYLLLSSVHSYTQSKAVMTNVTNNMADVTPAGMNIRCGAPLRCIKDK